MKSIEYVKELFEASENHYEKLVESLADSAGSVVWSKGPLIEIKPFEHRRKGIELGAVVKPPRKKIGFFENHFDKNGKPLLVREYDDDDEVFESFFSKEDDGAVAIFRFMKNRYGIEPYGVTLVDYSFATPLCSVTVSPSGCVIEKYSVEDSTVLIETDSESANGRKSHASEKIIAATLETADHKNVHQQPSADTFFSSYKSAVEQSLAEVLRTLFNNRKSIALVCLSYSDDLDSFFPPLIGWADQKRVSFLKQEFQNKYSSDQFNPEELNEFAKDELSLKIGKYKQIFLDLKSYAKQADIDQDEMKRSLFEICVEINQLKKIGDVVLPVGCLVYCIDDELVDINFVRELGGMN